jgi:general secretion pathway protein G
MDRKRGFTLLELIVVVMVLSILASIVAVAVLKEPGKARVTAAEVEIKATLEMALDRYYLAHGHYPSQEQGLKALIEIPQVEPIPRNYPPEGYLKKKRMPLDPWDNEYVYLVPGSEDSPYEIICYGSDGKPGGDGEAADISSLDL